MYSTTWDRKCFLLTAAYQMFNKKLLFNFIQLPWSFKYSLSSGFSLTQNIGYLQREAFSMWALFKRSNNWDSLVSVVTQPTVNWLMALWEHGLRENGLGGHSAFVLSGQPWPCSRDGIGLMHTNEFSVTSMSLSLFVTYIFLRKVQINFS